MTDTNLAAALQWPGMEHWLGTDPLGRDVLSRLLGASRVAAQAFLIVVLIGGVVGTAFGLIAGGRGGIIDLVVSRVTEILQGFPTILVAIVIVALLTPSLTNAMIAVGLAWGVPLALSALEGHAVGPIHERPFLGDLGAWARFAIGIAIFFAMERMV